MFDWLDLDRTGPVPGRPHMIRQWCKEHGCFAQTLASPGLQRAMRVHHAMTEHGEPDPFAGPEFVDADLEPPGPSWSNF